LPRTTAPPRNPLKKNASKKPAPPPRDTLLWVITDPGHTWIPPAAVATFCVAIDAFAIYSFTETVWLSFDTTVDLFGTVLRDSDVFDGLFNRVFDATAAGVPAGLDVDAVGMLPPMNDLLLSFDTGGTLGGITFADEDVLRYYPDGDTWTLAVDTSATQPNWAAADLDALTAVPESEAALMLAMGFAALVLFARRRVA
jgi:hypothetical protein